ncbi:MAG: hypothetical protein CSA50_06900 [Gammaproteobacteria bacterium]|nr:MAG: hypothetical protein CSA50_06900 [Gammaproteobacteria bacterium]
MRKLVDPRYVSQAMAQLGSDLTKRSMIGAVVYLLVWVAVVLPSVTATADPSQKTVLILFTALVAAVSGVRFLCIYGYRNYQKKNNRKTTSLPLWPLHAGVFLSGGLWGGISYYLLTTPAFADFSVPLFIATTGLCAAGVSSLAPCRECVIVYLILLLGPLVAALYSGNIPNAESITWLFLIYMPALYTVSSLHRKEYFTFLNAKFSLQEKSARLAELNTIDNSTGLKNHRFFENRLAYEFKRSIREETPISIILVDIDRFKLVNEKYGRQIGDESIKEMARSIACLFNRSVDIVARYDSDEFAILLPSTPYENAKYLAERVRKKIAGMVIKYQDADIKFTASIGVNCCIPDNGSSEVELLLQTEKALHRASAHGGNQIAVCDFEPSNKKEEEEISTEAVNFKHQTRTEKPHRLLRHPIAEQQ